jgi:hypothetical protein
MTIEQLEKIRRATPFKQFDIYLSDGRSIPVEHPEFLLVPPPGRTFAVGMADGTIEIIDLLHVTSFKPRSNGSRRRRTE